MEQGENGRRYGGRKWKGENEGTQESWTKNWPKINKAKYSEKMEQIWKTNVNENHVWGIKIK
jgi:hypothetical protein